MDIDHAWYTVYRCVLGCFCGVMSWIETCPVHVCGGVWMSKSTALCVYMWVQCTIIYIHVRADLGTLADWLK